MSNFLYYPILGKPLMIWLGLIALVLLMFTAAVPFLNKKGITKIPVKYHQMLAAIALVLALIHAINAIIAYF